MTNTNMLTQSSVVYQEIEEVLQCFVLGIPLSHWSAVEIYYQLKFNKSLDYESLGVTDVNQLLKKMGKKVALFGNRERGERYVMSGPVAKFRRKINLKPDVEKLLYMHGGKIEFDSFENFYKDQLKENLFYGYYGLTDLDHLCQIFEKILVVGEEKSSGKKVIKAVEGMCNKRARNN